MTLRSRLHEALHNGQGDDVVLLTGDHREVDPQPDPTLVAAAVLVAVTDRAEPGVILTRRTDTLSRHAGQVAFPGGRIDPEDDGAIAAALREAEEEIALPRSVVTIIGMADQYRTVTGFEVTPVIAVVPPDLVFTPSAGEVAEVFEVPLGFVLDSANHVEATVEFQGHNRHYYEIGWNGYRIWGGDGGDDRQSFTAVAMGDMMLPNAPWRHRSGLDRLCDVLGARAGQVRFVGGAVRDALLGIDVADIDLATIHSPDQVMALLKGNDIRAVPTGLAHGTITAILPDGPVEVTTLRCDLETDGRHAVVAFTGDWREDAARRDFTMNALYADPLSGEIFDYFGGSDDLAAGVVRFIGDPLARIAEDHLRILRFFRFHARFGDVIDADGLSACAARANDLMALSRERIAAELLRLLVARHAVAVVALMVERGILAPVLPEITREGCDRLARLAAREQEAGVAGDAIRRLAALLPRNPATGDEVGARLKLSNQQRKRLSSALTEWEGAPRAMAYCLGTDMAIDRRLLADGEPAMVTGAVREIMAWEIPKLPLTGGALVEAGVRKGPEVARLLRSIEEQWIGEDFPDQRRLDQIALAKLDAWRLAQKN